LDAGVLHLEVLSVVTPPKLLPIRRISKLLRGFVGKGQVVVVVLELEDGNGVRDLEADDSQVEVISLGYDALGKGLLILTDNRLIDGFVEFGVDVDVISLRAHIP